jgi:diguanylate cyclase (GGDEF)-like protein
MEGRSSAAVPEAASPGEDRRVMALTLGALFFAGATIGAISLLLPHPEQFDTAGLWSNIAISCVVALALIIGAGRIPVWALQLTILGGTIVITRAVYLSGEPGGFYTFFYIWIGLYAFFFFGRLWGALHMAAVGLAFAWVETQIELTSPIGRWMMAISTIAIGGILINVLAGRVRASAADAYKRARALTAVDSVAHQLSRSTSPDSAAQTICGAALHAAHAAGASLWLPTSDGSGLRASAASDPSLPGRHVLFVGPPSGVIRAFTSRQPFFVPDASGDADVDQDIAEELGAVSVLFQPVIRDGVPIAVLAVYWDRPVKSLDDELAQVIALLAAETSNAIERTELLERLERAARTDDLTGLLNRRAWDEQVTREVARARRSGNPLCVAMLDVDHFKAYNDRHGHQAGDRLLKEAAAEWGLRVRDTDLLARYGGDEFALALPDCGMEEAVELLEALRSATPEDESSSAGIASWNGSESDLDLMTRADRALYEAKRAGRDRIVQG